MQKLKSTLALAICAGLLISCTKQASKSKLKGTWNVNSIQKTRTYTDPNDPSFIYETTYEFDGTNYVTTHNDNGTITTGEKTYTEYSYTFNTDNSYELRKTFHSPGFPSSAVTEIEKGSYSLLGAEKVNDIKKNTRIYFTILEEGDASTGTYTSYEPGYREYFMTVEKCTNKELIFNMKTQSETFDNQGFAQNLTINEKITLNK